LRTSTGREGGVSTGGVHDVRFAGLDWWQGVVLEFAKRLGLELDMNLVETMSTCTLRLLPAEAREVTNWHALVGSFTLSSVRSWKPRPWQMGHARLARSECRLAAQWSRTGRAGPGNF